MLLEQFYDILDKELDTIIANNKAEIVERKLNQANQQKGYALLIWFLQIYAPNKIFKDYITDGKDDSSCDIIFSNKENGEIIFYVIQSKWNLKPKLKEDNQVEKISSDEVKKAIVDFESIFRKDKKKGKNELFNQKLDDLHKHRVENGGAIKFIFLGLLPHNEEVNEHIRNFENSYFPCKLEVMDIERLRRDYIEFTYKQIEVYNPLAYSYANPIDDKIILPIERIENSMGKGDHLKIEKPYESYILLLKPKTIFDLFEKYKFSLFFNNVRNPLPQSNYNQAIVDTLNKKPEMFWYFNNGITAISKMIKPVGFDSQIAELRGLQIINGAQTVYSVYSAYKNANEGQREIMDLETKINLRLIRSNNDDMNLEITRYTNSQNPMEARDFWANDEVQIRLQEESFKTKYWYGKRRGEFRTVPDGIEVIENSYFAKVYLAFWLQEPVLVRDIHFADDFQENYINPIFISHKQSINGLYEVVFNKTTTFEKMLSALLMNDAISVPNSINNRLLKNSPYQLTGFPLLENNGDNWFYLALCKIVFEKYIEQKYDKNADINRLIRKYYFQDNEYTLMKILLFIGLRTKEVFGENKRDKTSKIFFDRVKEYFETTPLNTNEIDKIGIGKWKE
jgi:hypothetical protein